MCGTGSICDHLFFHKIDKEADINMVSDGYGSGINTVGNGMAQTANGGVLAVGNQFDNSSNSIDIYLAFQASPFINISATTKMLDEPGDQLAKAAVGLSNNTYAVIGHSDNNASGPSDLLFFRLDQQLNLLIVHKKLVCID